MDCARTGSEVDVTPRWDVVMLSITCIVDSCLVIILAAINIRVQKRLLAIERRHREEDVRAAEHVKILQAVMEQKK